MSDTTDKARGLLEAIGYAIATEDWDNIFDIAGRLAEHHRHTLNYIEATEPTDKEQSVINAEGCHRCQANLIRNIGARRRFEEAVGGEEDDPDDPVPRGPKYRF